VRVVTWNLWGRHDRWLARKELIAATLADVGADLCGLQEVWSADGSNLAAELGERLGMQWRWQPADPAGCGHDGVRVGNAILSRWPILTDSAASLPCVDSDQGRIALHAIVDGPSGFLPMFTTHLTHYPGGSQIRLAQVRRLAEFIAEKAADCPYPPVLTGDLNAEPESDEIRLLGGMLTAPAVPEQVLVDAWRYAEAPDPSWTLDRRNGYRAGRVIPGSRVDYIFVGWPRNGNGRITSARLAGDAPVNGMWPSDHFAVVADLE
jgi:endonuclease/exonuclease/phosphatase family metal-dependent hydrolase